MEQVPPRNPPASLLKLSHPFRQLLREVDRLDGTPGTSGELLSALELGSDTFQRFSIEKRFKSKTSPVLLAFTGASPKRKKSRFLLKREDVRPEWAAMGLMSMIRQRWQAAGRFRWAVIQYQIWPIGSGAGLIEFVENARTLDSLKRQADKFRRPRHRRVLDYLGAFAVHVENLACSAAAYLAFNYVLGVCDGHGENIMLTADGCLFRVDFDHLFGNFAALPLLQVPFDMPIVWLPWAVVVALKETDMWDFMLEESLQLLQDVLQGPPDFWLDLLAAAHSIDNLWDLGAAEYLASLSEEKFRDALNAVEGSMMRGWKSGLHFRFGYGERPIPSPPDIVDTADEDDTPADVLDHLNNLQDIMNFRVPDWHRAKAQLLRHSSPLVRRSALAALSRLSSGPDASLIAGLSPELAELFLEDDPGVRLEAVRLVGALGAAAADRAKSVVSLFDDPDAEVAKAAVRAVGQLQVRGRDQFEALAKLHSHVNVAVRAAAALVLGRLLALALSSAACDPDGVQVGAEKSDPADVGDDSEGPCLLSQFLEDICPEVQVAALQGIARLGAAQRLPLASKLRVAALLSSEEIVVRCAAAAALATCWPQRAASLQELVDDRCAIVRCAAARAIAQSGSTEEQLLRSVAGLLADADGAVRAAACEALAQMGERDAGHLATVASLLRDNASEVRHSALMALAKMYSETVLGATPLYIGMLPHRPVTSSAPTLP